MFASPTSFRLNNMDAASGFDAGVPSPFVVFKKKPHDSHPSLDRLTLLVFEAVMEVVCVSLPGYIVARLGHFDADKQKFLANLNVMLFTPCLIFTKLASQLNASKLADLGVIPVIFIVQTLVSWAVARGVAKAFGFNRRASNFVTAMGVFGNSNSLPISLVISLSQTLKGLHWDRIPGDNDDEVGARGILYLLIFQQLGQLVRWSWGYHVLLAPKSSYPEYAVETSEEGRYRDDEDSDDDAHNTDYIPGLDGRISDDEHSSTPTEGSVVYEPAGRTPVAGQSRASPATSIHQSGSTDSLSTPKKRVAHDSNGVYPPHYQNLPEQGVDGMLSFPSIRNDEEAHHPTTFKGKMRKASHTASSFISRSSKAAFDSLPKPVRTALVKFNRFVWEFMNPPLWAMLIAIIVASVPDLQRLFFQEGSFVKNSVTSAVKQSAGVAVPLILVVLGANLARNTQKRDESADPEERAIGKRLLIASLLCRMLLPTLIMAPILALAAKYVPVSILDDPIFVIVCFLLTGAPSALQLAQICQLNEVYEGVMAKILFQSYVIWILPSTLILVLCALEVVEWAK